MGAPMPTARVGLAAGVVDGKLYALGGVSNDGELGLVEVFTILERPRPSFTPGAWSEVAPMPTARDGLAAGVVDGKLYALGGASNDGELAPLLDTVEVYDPAANTWDTVAPMPSKRWMMAAGVVDGKLYALGGENFDGSVLDTVEVYDPAANTWDTVAPMPTARGSLAAGVVGGKLYALGGNAGGDDFVHTVEVYDPATDTWHTVAPMSTKPANLAAAVVDGKLYTLGGLVNDPAIEETGQKAIDTVGVYDPATDTWAVVAPMPTARYGLAAGVVDGKLYALR